ncbi:MAG: replication initiation protein, partial [Nitrospirae bacterium]|nr:replication initiation protein [Nitrospirota bacterium]
SVLYPFDCKHLPPLKSVSLIIWLISQICPNDEDFRTYKMMISDFMEMLEIEHKGTYRRVQIITRKLMESVIEIQEPDGILQIAWFSSVKYYDGEGYVELCFDPKLKPYLLGLKERFLSYKLRNIVQLKSAYSIRIYEILKQYQKIGTRRIDIHYLKGLLGLSVNDYVLYADLKKRVIVPAMDELLQKTDIIFTFKEIKEGKKVTDLEFTIIANRPVDNITPKKYNSKKSKQKLLSLTPISDTINDTLNITPESTSLPTTNEIKKDKNGIIDLKDIIPSLPPEHQNKKTIIDAITSALKKHGADYVTSNIKYTNTHSQSNYRKYLIDALAKDYACGMREDIEEKKQRAIAGKKRKEERKQAVIVGNDLYEKALQYIKTLSKEELTAFEEEVLKNQPEDYRDRFKRGEMFAVKGVQHAIEGIIYERMLAEENKGTNVGNDV